MFDGKSYSSELINAKKALDKVNNQYYGELFALSDDADVSDFNKIEKKYAKKIQKAEERFATEHDKYCDKYNLQSMKIKENWSKFWNK